MNISIAKPRDRIETSRFRRANSSTATADRKTPKTRTYDHRCNAGAAGPSPWATKAIIVFEDRSGWNGCDTDVFRPMK